MVATLTFMPFILNGSITTLTSLDFLGFGLPPGSPSLGELLAQGKDNLQAPWLGLTAFFVIAIMLIAPHLRRRGGARRARSAQDLGIGRCTDRIRIVTITRRLATPAMPTRAMLMARQLMPMTSGGWGSRRSSPASSCSPRSAGGIAAGSLALLADAGHMLTDFASLSLAWFGFRLSRRPADWRRTYGFDRFQVLIAFANGLALFAIAGWIVYEAIERLMTTPQVSGGIMVVVAALGLLVNVAAFFLLRGADRDNLNVRGAVIHVLGDLLGSVAALDRRRGDPAHRLDDDRSRCSRSWLRRSSSGADGRWLPTAGHILLEGAPGELDTRGDRPRPGRTVCEGVRGCTTSMSGRSRRAAAW